MAGGRGDAPQEETLIGNSLAEHIWPASSPIQNQRCLDQNRNKVQCSLLCSPDLSHQCSQTSSHSPSPEMRGSKEEEKAARIRTGHGEK